MKITRMEQGWAAHFICGPRCEFHRATLLTRGRTRVIVSTVGAYRQTHDKPLETIGCDRYYETMAFYAKKKKDGPYWHIDVSREFSFDSPWAIGDIKKDADLRADRMHERVVKEIMRKLNARPC